MSNALSKLHAFPKGVAVLAVGLLGCDSATARRASPDSAKGASEHASVGGHAGAAEGTAGAGRTDAAGAAAEAPEDTFTHLYQRVFSPCKLDICHGGGLIGIDFSTRDAAYASRVNHASNPTAICAKLGKRRVVPGDPDASLLNLKLDNAAPCGQQMPPGGQLSDAARAEVRRWIADGARDD